MQFNDTKNIWQCLIRLLPGKLDKHEENMTSLSGEYDYKFVVDGEWRVDETAPVHTTVHGFINNWVVVHPWISNTTHWLTDPQAFDRIRRNTDLLDHMLKTLAIKQAAALFVQQLDV